MVNIGLHRIINKDVHFLGVNCRGPLFSVGIGIIRWFACDNDAFLGIPSIWLRFGCGARMKKMVVSACLLGEKCKYNGGDNRNEGLLELLAGRDDIEAIPVCPEVAGGLPTPRPPAEIVNGAVACQDGTSVDAEYRAGVAAILEKLRPDIDSGEVEAAVLQSRSPSCGVREVYDGTFSGTLVPGQGLFAMALQNEGIRLIDVADLQG